MVAAGAPGVLTILTSSLFQSTTTAPDPEPAGAAAAAVPLPVACWYATTANVAASVRATPANAINGFFMVRDFSSALFRDSVWGTGGDRRPRYKQPPAT